MNKNRAPSKILHPIALQLIFEKLIPPSGFLDPSLCAGPYSPWCQVLRTKKDFTLVCKAWREAAMPLLYGEITLRRVGQLFALVQTIRNTEYACMVWSLTLTCHIPDDYKQLVEEGLAYILSHCSNISCLSFASTFADWLPSNPLDPTEVPDSVLTVVLREVGPRITTFRYDAVRNSSGMQRYTSPMQLFQSFTSLVSLTLLFPSSSPNQTSTNFQLHVIPDLPPIHLPTLETLTLRYEDDDNYLLSISCNWEMPKLKAITFRPHFNYHATRLDLYSQFLHKFGHGIKYLEFGHPFRGSFQEFADKVPAIFRMCPCLEHLVILNSGLVRSVLPSMFFPSVASYHIDIWLEYPTNYSGESFADLFSPDNRFFRPGVRVLDSSLVQLPDLPRLLPPVSTELGNHAPIVHRMLGLCIVETNWCIFRHSPEWDGNWDGLPETLGDMDNMSNSGSSFEPSLSDYESDSTSYVDSEVDDEDVIGDDSASGSEFIRIKASKSGTEDQPKLTEEEVLEIFMTQLESTRVPDLKESSESEDTWDLENVVSDSPSKFPVL